MSRAVLLVAGLLGVPAFVKAAPEDDGPLAVVVTSDVMVPVASSLQLATDLYAPQSGGPFPVLVVRHGFGRSKSNFTNWGRHLASRGLVVLVPNARAPLAPDPAQDSDDMLAVLAWAVAQSAQSGSPLSAKVDPSRRAVAGHSAGGLAAIVAASKDAALGAVVLLDPVEGMNGMPGVSAAAATRIPTLAIFAEPSSCNDNGSGLPMFRALAGPRYGLRTIGATHCDPENPSDSLCASFCGGAATAARQAEFSRYATAFLLAYLTCDASSLPYVDGVAAMADGAVARLPETAIVAPCGSDADAGADSGLDSGTVDGAGGAAGTGGSGGSGGDGAAPPSSAGGCGCIVSGRPDGIAGAVGVMALLTLLIARELRRRGWRRRARNHHGAGEPASSSS